MKYSTKRRGVSNVTVDGGRWATTNANLNETLCSLCSLCPLWFTHRPPSTVRRPPSTVRRPPSTVGTGTRAIISYGWDCRDFVHATRGVASAAGAGAAGGLFV